MRHKFLKYFRWIKINDIYSLYHGQLKTLKEIKGEKIKKKKKGKGKGKIKGKLDKIK